MSTVHFVVVVAVSYASAQGDYQCYQDIAPSSDYSCSQQVEFGKCGETWMQGWCCASCPAACSASCSASGQYSCNTDVVPPTSTDYTCTQQVSWSKCGESWMQGYCCSSCSESCSSQCSGSGSGSGSGAGSPSRFALAEGTNLRIGESRLVFQYGDNDVFLNGANQPWVNYGNDFGGARDSDVAWKLEQELVRIAEAGGNAVRTWLFVEAKYIPLFDSSGYATQSDTDDSLADDLLAYLDKAQENQVFVILSLWNAAVDFNGNPLHGILVDDTGAKLTAFIDNVLIPLVVKLAGHPALAAYEIINEPEGSLAVRTATTDNAACTDTQYLYNQGPPWTDVAISAEQFQRFINKQAAAIHNTDANALVTVGAWSEKSSTSNYGYKNLWSDECLVAAGGEQNGFLDFYQIHSYAHYGVYGDYSPWRVDDRDAYDLGKPVIIGEFGIAEGGGSDPTSMSEKYVYLFEHGYNGAFAWAMNDYSCDKSDGYALIVQGIQAVASYSSAAFSEFDDVDVEHEHGMSTARILLIVFAALSVVIVVFIVFVVYMKCVRVKQVSFDHDEEEEVAIELEEEQEIEVDVEVNGSLQETHQITNDQHIVDK